MTYELAKELKEARFPQKGNGEMIIYYTGDTVARIFYNQFVTLKIEGKPEIVYSPTLEELIEACGGSFDDLQKAGKLWIARGIVEKQSNSNLDILQQNTEPTSTEAVAKLWLALNKK